MIQIVFAKGFTSPTPLGTSDHAIVVGIHARQIASASAIAVLPVSPGRFHLPLLCASAACRFRERR